jgi:hypothetical protein
MTSVEELERTIGLVESSAGTLFSDLALTVAHSDNEATFIRRLIKSKHATLVICGAGQRDRALHALREGLDDIRLVDSSIAMDQAAAT